VVTCEFPLEHVKLIDINLWLIAEWDGYLVPPELELIPNKNAAMLPEIEFACGYKTMVALNRGNLHEDVWVCLLQHDPKVHSIRCVFDGPAPIGWEWETVA
jgi:hypothetical protein